MLWYLVLCPGISFPAPRPKADPDAAQQPAAPASATVKPDPGVGQALASVPTACVSNSEPGAGGDAAGASGTIAKALGVGHLTPNPDAPSHPQAAPWGLTRTQHRRRTLTGRVPLLHQ